MAEFKLNYTGNEINNKLATVDLHSTKITEIDSVFDHINVGNGNILDPSNSESGSYSAENLVVGEKLVPINFNGRTRSINPIAIPDGTENLYIRTSLEVATDSSVYINYLDEQEGFISNTGCKFTDIIAGKDSYYNTSVPNDCAYIHVVVGGASVGYNFDTVCISCVPLDSFGSQSITLQRVLKEVALPDDIAMLPEQVHELSEQLEAIQQGGTDDEELIDIRIGYDDTVYNSAGEAVRSQISNIESAFDNINTKNNVLDPNNSESGTFTPTVGEKLVPSNNSGRFRSINSIHIPSGTERLYIRTSLESETTASVYIYYLDAEERYISLSDCKITAIIAGKDNSYNKAIPVNCEYIHVVVGGKSSGYDFSKVCISFEALDSFEAYTLVEQKTLKESALPKCFATLQGQVESINDQIELGSSKKLQGKTVINFGDSIFGLASAPTDISTYLAELTGATVHNCGFGSCTMAKHDLVNFDPFSMYRLADEIVKPDTDSTKWELQETAIANPTGQTAVDDSFPGKLELLKNLDFNNVDIITIAYGANDLTRDSKLDDAENPYDTTTFAGALRYSIEKLFGTYPHLKIFVCSQIFRFWSTDGVVTNTDDTFVNTSGNKIADFEEKAEEVAREYKLPYINNHNIGMNIYNRSHYFTSSRDDGTHPLATGRRLIAENMAKELF